MTTSADTPLRIAAVGLGGMGMQHVHALSRSTYWTTTWVCDLDTERQQRAVDLVPTARGTADYDALLSDPQLDAVSLNTLSNIRPDLIRRALAAGKHVICEKPLAPDPDTAAALAEEATTSGRICTVNLFNRNAPYLQRVANWIEEGLLGSIGVIRIDHCTPGPGLHHRLADTHRAVEGHVLHDCGMHYVDVIRWLAGADITDFRARAVRFWDETFENHFMVQGRCANGVAFDLNNGFVYGPLLPEDQRVNQSMVELIGSRGTVRLSHDFDNVTTRLRTRDQQIDDRMPYGGKKLPRFYAAFAQAIRSGDASALPQFADAVIASRTAQAMVDQALNEPVPSFGEAEEWQDALATATVTQST